VYLGVADDEDMEESLPQWSSVLHLPAGLVVLPFGEGVVQAQRRLDRNFNLTNHLNFYMDKIYS
jgi:hypothetical protein